MPINNRLFLKTVPTRTGGYGLGKELQETHFLLLLYSLTFYSCACYTFSLSLCIYHALFSEPITSQCPNISLPLPLLPSLWFVMQVLTSYHVYHFTYFWHSIFVQSDDFQLSSSQWSLLYPNCPILSAKVLTQHFYIIHFSSAHRKDQYVSEHVTYTSHIPESIKSKLSINLEATVTDYLKE